MSLITGDQKDELPWSDTLPLVAELTDRRIGQVWCDHTGHNTDRQYGSSTKAWRFDAVGVMTAPPGATDPKSVTFNLSFHFPGKARRRTPDNWHDFEAIDVRLENDAWTATTATKEAPTPKGGAAAVKGPKPGAVATYAALQAITGSTGTATRDEWYAECGGAGWPTRYLTAQPPGLRTEQSGFRAACPTLSSTNGLPLPRGRQPTSEMRAPARALQQSSNYRQLNRVAIAVRSARNGPRSADLRNGSRTPGSGSHGPQR